MMGRNQEETDERRERICGMVIVVAWDDDKIAEVVCRILRGRGSRWCARSIGSAQVVCNASESGYPRLKMKHEIQGGEQLRDQRNKEQ